jgi:hypothetical protein
MNTANNYRVPGKKMTSRFFMSHKAMRAEAKFHAEFYKGAPPEYGGDRLKYTTKRLQKKCQHKRWVDTGHGGPEGGHDSGHCRDCGWAFHHVMY